MSRGRMLLVAMAVVLGGCGGWDIAPTAPGTASLAAITREPSFALAPTVNPTPPRTVSPRPPGTPLPFLPDLEDADAFKAGLIDRLGFACTTGAAASDLMWTCSYGDDEVAISVYGSSPPRVTAMRVVTKADKEVDRRSWLRMYASIISVSAFQWVDAHFGTNETVKVGDVWVQVTHDATSDGVLISAGEGGPDSGAR